MPFRALVIKRHASIRMLERRIQLQDVIGVLDTGLTIERYPDDEPYPSRLMLGWVGERPIHVVVAEDADETAYIITVYEPDPAEWNADFTLRTNP